MPVNRTFSRRESPDTPRVRIGALAAIEACGPYTCARHPQLRRGFPGNCPKCALPLIAWRERDALAATEEEYGRLVGRLRLALFSAVGCLLLGMTGLPEGLRAWSLELQFLLAAPVIVWSAQPILAEAWGALRAGRRDAHQPLTAALVLAFAAGIAGTVDPTFLGTAIGRAVLDLRPYAAATSAIAGALLVRWVAVAVARAEIVAHRRRFSFHDGKARVVRDCAETETLVAYLQNRDVVRVLEGEAVPADGFVVDGRGAATRYPVGPDGAVPVGPGDYVYAGTVLKEGVVTVLVTETGDGVAMRKFGKVPAWLDPKGFDPGAEAHALPGAFFSVVAGLAAAGAILCAAVRPEGVLAAGFAVLVGATPCGAAYLGLPLRVIALLRAARLGALVRGEGALEKLARASGTVAPPMVPERLLEEELRVLGPAKAGRDLVVIGASLAIEVGSVFAGAWIKAAGPGDFPDCTRVGVDEDGVIEAIFPDGEYGLVPAEACAGRKLYTESVIATHHLVKDGRVVLSVALAPAGSAVSADGDTVVGFAGELSARVSGGRPHIALVTGRMEMAEGADAVLIQPSEASLRALLRLAARYASRASGQRRFLIAAACVCAGLAAAGTAWVPSGFPAATAASLLPVLPALWPIFAAMRRVRP